MSDAIVTLINGKERSRRSLHRMRTNIARLSNDDLTNNEILLRVHHASNTCSPDCPCYEFIEMIVVEKVLRAQ